MNMNEFNGLVADILDTSISRIEQSHDCFEVEFSSSAGLDYDNPQSFDFSVSDVKSFSYDGIGGEIIVCVGVSVRVEAYKYDGIDKEKVFIGSYEGFIEPTCTVQYSIDHDGKVKIDELSFDKTVIEIDCDKQFD